MNKLKSILASAAIAAMPFASFVVAPAAHAADAPDLVGGLTEVNTNAGFSSGSLTSTIGSLINTFIGVLGIVFLFLVIYAGFLWMTAAGDDKKIEKAKNILIQAVVGLVVLLSAYAISNFVITQIGTATTTGTGYSG